MGRIEERFLTLRSARKKALVAYLCVGDPSVEESVELLAEAADAGADFLELGVPFSDPIADGPVIAKSGARALAAGSSLRRVLGAARTLRARVAAPLVLFSYYNPIFVYGNSGLVAAARESGVDGLLVVDLPPEEGEDLRDAARAAEIPIIPLLTPTSDASRVASAKRDARGFLYYVSVTGVTGAAAAPLADAADSAARLRDASGLPVVVGFGIDSAEKARAAAGKIGAGADGVVVGTALVRAVEAGRDLGERRKNVRALITTLRAALDGA